MRRSARPSRSRGERRTSALTRFGPRTGSPASETPASGERCARTAHIRPLAGRSISNVPSPGRIPKRWLDTGCASRPAAQVAQSPRLCGSTPGAERSVRQGNVLWIVTGPATSPPRTPLPGPAERRGRRDAADPPFALPAARAVLDVRPASVSSRAAADVLQPRLGYRASSPPCGSRAHQGRLLPKGRQPSGVAVDVDPNDDPAVSDDVRGTFDQLASRGDSRRTNPAEWRGWIPVGSARGTSRRIFLGARGVISAVVRSRGLVAAMADPRGAGRPGPHRDRAVGQEGIGRLSVIDSQTDAVATLVIAWQSVAAAVVIDSAGPGAGDSATGQ